MKMKTQIKHFLVKLLNVLLSFTTFTIRRKLLSFLGNKIGKNTYLHNRVKLFSLTKLEIGANTTINFGAYLDNRCEIKIGDNVMIGHNSKIYTLSHDINSKDFKTTAGPVRVEDNCVVFPNCLVMPNTILSEGTVLLPGAVFSGKSVKYGVYGGVPAKLKSMRNPIINYKLNYGYYWAN